MTTNQNNAKVTTIDAAGTTIGRVATQAAVALMGKDEPTLSSAT